MLQAKLRSLNSSASNFNQQEVYLDQAKLHHAMRASRRHLQRHPEWLRGPMRRDDAKLLNYVAVQHFIDLDLEDLSLPEKERRYTDTFGGSGGHMSKQFLVDGPRCSIKVDGRVFSFSGFVESRRLTAGLVAGLVELLPGQSYVGSGDQEEATKKAFMEELTSAVRRSLRYLGNRQALLFRVVTTIMSQSGLASVERGCLPHLVVSGGDHHVHLELKSSRSNCMSLTRYWDVQLRVEKFGFDRFVICKAPVDADGKNAGFETFPCRVDSSITKECTIRLFCFPGKARVEADVIDVHADINLLGTTATRDILTRR